MKSSAPGARAHGATEPLRYVARHSVTDGMHDAELTRPPNCQTENLVLTRRHQSPNLALCGPLHRFRRG